MQWLNIWDIARKFQPKVDDVNNCLQGGKGCKNHLVAPWSATSSWWAALTGLGSVGIVAVEENKGADNWKASHCATALVTLVTIVKLYHSTCHTCHNVTLCHCTCHTAATWQEVISTFSAEGTIVKADSSIMEESTLKPRFLSKFLVGQCEGSVC